MFGILFVPKIVNRIQQQDWVSSNRLSASQNELVYINLNGENKKVPDFVLTNQDSLFISNEDYLGKVYLVEFFFTSCPTICPRMNVNMKKIEAVFGDREDFGIASITIDPETDTPSQLKTYAEAYEVFSPNWHFLTGDQDYIYELANRGFNIFAGINRCDWVAEGIVQALSKIEIKHPLVIRLAGTNVEKGNEILKKSNINYIEASTLEDAANKAVKALG